MHVSPPDVMGHGERGSSVQQELKDLIVVLMGGEDQGRDVLGEGGRLSGQRLPALAEEIR